MPGLPPVLSQDGVCDYSFMEIHDLWDIVHVNEDSDDDAAPPPPSPTHKDGLDSNGDAAGQNVVEEREKLKDMKALRISSNNITDISPLYTNLNHVLDSPSSLKWIDLSYNSISTIGSSLEKFENLTVLYLHANKITSLSALKPLTSLKHLHKLSLHGNEIEGQKHYRSYVIWLLPGLQMLDFSCITKQDRVDSGVWAEVFRKKLRRKKEKEQGF